jgi:2,5-diketo-D-gluconate reductase A
MIPHINLNDGTTIPQLGFGTLFVPPDMSVSEENTKAAAAVVRQALEVGYRHIDTAQAYRNEAGVGRGVATSSVPSTEVYLASKLSNTNHGPDDVGRSFGETLDSLGVEQLDLFLIHWPLPTLYGGDFVSTWKAVADLRTSGRLRSAGVSNFQPSHLDRIVNETGVVPVVNQIEVHPYFRNDAARAACANYGIAVEAWSPLGHGSVLEDPTIAVIAADHDKTAAQVVLRWQIQRGHIVIPKTRQRQRMEENIRIFDFELSADDMAAIDDLDRGEEGRTGPNPDTYDRPRLA